MSDTRKLFKLLLNKGFYIEHAQKLPVQSFDEFGRDLLPTLRTAFDKLERDITTEDLLQFHMAANPVMTTAQKHSFQSYLDRVKDEADVSLDTGKVVYSSAWRSEVGRKVAEFGIKLGDGEHDNLEDLLDYLSTVASDFTPTDDIASPVDTSPIALVKRLEQQGKWKFNIPGLDKRVNRIPGGSLIILLARPETGKTATVVNLIAGKDGWAAQGANVHLLCNEEGAEATAGRATCCFNEISFDDLMSKPELADNAAWNDVRQRLTFLHRPEITIAQLDAYCKKHKPDVVVVDQLDHLGTNDTFEKGHERLGAVYRRAREIASKYNCVIVGVSQASAEAEDKTRVSFSMAEGSKTAKAAAADLIVGIGKSNDNSQEGEGNVVLRHFHVSKNKITGYKGTIVCQLIQNQSRFVA